MSASQVSPQTASRVNRRTVLAPVLLGGTLLLLLIAAPEEETLGKVVKLVYLHGAMVRTAILLLLLALPLHLAAMAGRRGAAPAWGSALTGAGIIVWLVHTLLSVVTTYAAWGIWIAWDEPRTIFTLGVAAFSLLAAAASRVLHGERLAHLPPALLSVAVLGILPRLGFIQHPIDPIGRSTSATIRGFYVAILAVSAATGILLASRLRNRGRPPR